jgi:hypothetical protein
MWSPCLVLINLVLLIQLRSIDCDFPFGIVNIKRFRLLALDLNSIDWLWSEQNLCISFTSPLRTLSSFSIMFFEYVSKWEVFDRWDTLT